MPAIADHKGILCKLPFNEVLEKSIKREIWHLDKAKWKDLEEALEKFDWGGLKEGTAEDAIGFFMEVLWFHLVKFIPREWVEEKKTTHPWLNERTRKAIARKQEAEGTAQAQVEMERCSRILNEERQKYVQRLKEKLMSLPKGSKQWWKINRELLNKKVRFHQFHL